MKILFSIPHVRLVQDERLILEIEDTEVFHYLDDTLTEQFDIISLGHTSRSGSGTFEIYKLYFEGNIVADLINALKTLDEREITYLFRLNN